MVSSLVLAAEIASCYISYLKQWKGPVMTLVHGFKLNRQETISELNAEAKLYRHQRTGAELLSLQTEDTNKVFGITFRTPPTDSTGVAHILEHSVLCGSRKYPVKEPFVELLKGSLQTFLNAMTYPDKTCYPVASENLQDFYNLIDVYLDAVFYPRITEQIFAQEGWHYELETPTEPLRYKGVVFNEMKGVHSSPDDMLGEHSQQSLFPDSTYGVDSGGDPSIIPSLTYKQFSEFHRSFYHPSNSLIYFYGDDDPDERLSIIDKFIADFGANQPIPDIVPQPSISRPISVVKSYDPGEQDPEHAKAMMTVNWLLPNVTDLDLNMDLGILTHILIGTPASPLRQALLDSGLGEDLAGNGFANYILQMYFSTGLRGIDSEKAPQVETLIFDTLTRLVKEGLNPDLIEAALNTSEFRLRESNTGGYPRGLAYMLASLNFWLYGADPIVPLKFEAPLSRLKERLTTQNRYFESLIDQHFLSNLHRSTVLLTPDSGLADRKEQEEQTALATTKAGLSDAQLAEIVAACRSLKEAQQAQDDPEALAAIPMLRREDMTPTIKTVPTDIEQLAGTDVLVHDIFTNGILYLDIAFDLHTLPDEYLPLLPLFGRCLTEIGTEHEDFISLSNRIGRITGGIGATNLSASVANSDTAATWLVLRSKATVARAKDLFDLLLDVLTQTKFDNQERFRQMVLEDKSSFEAHLVPSGSSVVDTRLHSCFNEAGWTNEQMHGVSNLFYVRKLAQLVDDDWPLVLGQLEEMRKILINASSAICNVTIDRKSWLSLGPSLDKLLTQLPHNPPEPYTRTVTLTTQNEGLTIPSQVNYVGKGVSLYAHDYQHHGSASVILNSIRSSWLWDQVRVQGGAYGAFCSLDSRSGIFCYGSYRDPNFHETLDIYDATSDFLSTTDFSEAEISKNVIGAIGSLDSYQLPDAQGYSALIRHLTGVTDEERQTRRDEVLGTTKEHYRAFVDALNIVRDHGTVVALGSRDVLSKAGEGRPSLTMTSVL